MKAYQTVARQYVDAATLVAINVEVSFTFEVGFCADGLWCQQIVATRRVHMQKVDKRHRRGGAEFNVKTDFYKHKNLADEKK